MPLDLSTPPVKLSGSTVVGGGVSPNTYPATFEGLDSYQNGFRVGPDGWCVYEADARTAGIDELYRVPVDGSAAPVRLSGDLRVHTFGITADGAHLVTYAFPAGGSGNLYGIPLPGGVPLVLNQPQDYFGGFRLSRSGSRVLYDADADQDGILEHALLTVPADGSSAPGLLSAGIQAALGFDFETTPDGMRALFLPDPYLGYTGKNLYSCSF